MEKEWVALGAGYGLGCFSTGYYLARIRLGIDIRDTGSGSAGASNVGRTLGKTGFAVTFAGDFLKGMLAVALADTMAGSLPVAGLAMAGVVTGHIFPIQLRGRGGKGVATAFGAVLACDCRLALGLAGLFALLYLLSRQWLWCGLIVVLFAPFAAYLIGLPLPFILACGSVALLVTFAHRDNIRQGLSSKRASFPSTPPGGE